MSAVELRFDEGNPWHIEQKIFDLLKELVQPSSTLSPAAAAQTIDRLFPPNRSGDNEPEGAKRETPGSFVWFMWVRFHDVARQIPHDSPAQERLAALVKELHQTTSRTPTITMGSWETEYKMWQDLPNFGATLAEETDGECGLQGGAAVEMSPSGVVMSS